MKFVVKCKAVFVVSRLRASLHRYRDGLFGGAFVYLGARRRPPLIRFTPHFPTNPFFPVRHALSSPCLPWLSPYSAFTVNRRLPDPSSVYIFPYRQVMSLSVPGKAPHLGSVSCIFPATSHGRVREEAAVIPVMPLGLRLRCKPGAAAGGPASSVWLTGPNRTEVGACSSLAEAWLRCASLSCDLRMTDGLCVGDD